MSGSTTGKKNGLVSGVLAAASGRRLALAIGAAFAVWTGGTGASHALGKVELEMVFTNASAFSQQFFYNPPARYRSVAPGRTIQEARELEGPGFDPRTGGLLGGAHGGVGVPFGKCYFSLSYKTRQPSRDEYTYQSCTVTVTQGGANCVGRATVMSSTRCRVELTVK